MNESQICQALYRYFANYEYKLNNTFVFNWESDFLGMSKSGYFIEVEVKVSRSDFFADFKKEKHRLFQDVVAGKTHFIYRHGIQKWLPNNQNIICKSEEYQLVTEWGPIKRRDGSMYSRSNPWNEHPWRQGRKNGKPGYWVNDYGDVNLVKRKVALYAPFNRITIKSMDEIITPNQLYYAVPKGLVKPEEVPKYAGLLEVSDGEVVMTRKAPYIHKRKMDLTKILLKKFYNLWRFKVPYETKQLIIEHYSE